MGESEPSSLPAMSTHDPTIMRHPHQLHTVYDYRVLQALPTDFAAHLQMPHIPLPLETPLPPSSYDFTSHGVFHIPQTMQGPQSHPLFEGVVAMHQMLGHDLNISWTDMAACNQPSAMSYSHDSPYACEPMLQWPSPPASIIDSTPSPLEESMPHTPEHLSDHFSEPLIVADDSPLTPLHPLPHLAATSGYSRFPVVVTGTKTHEHTVAFQYDRQKSEKASSKLDPHAADFIREKLGEQRWNIFSSRLAERRTTIQKPKPKPADGTAIQDGSQIDSFPSDKGGATVIDFLVKVEVVKNVLRTFVPHPYNPLKTLSHSFPPAPSGQVTLSRSTVLTLSGWSNTQFSYWARRAEAISVLAVHDERLRTAATALERRLRRSGLVESASVHEPSSPSSLPSSSFSRHTQEFASSSRSAQNFEVDPEEWVRLYVTGKGLDVIIDEVKKRTGLSPFLRGKHSSLDPFGTASVEGDGGGGGGGGRAAVYMPTFQAEKYVHEVPAEVDPLALSEMVGSKSSGKRKAMSPSKDEDDSDESLWPFDAASDDFIATLTSSVSRTHSSSPPLLLPEELQNINPPHSLNYDFTTPPSELSRAVAQPESTIRPKKRRLAPAPARPTPMHPDFGTDASRLYYNHLQTR